MAGVSIIVPTCDRSEDLRICLERLTSQLPADGGVEILVCDDGQTNDTREMLAREFPTVRWHAGPRRGPAANRNSGASEARGEWLIFVDDDCLPREGFLSAHLAARTTERAAIVGPTVRLTARPSLMWEAPHNPGARDFISCNFAMSKALFAGVGYFDERFPMALFEDTELAARMVRMGVEIRPVAAAVVDHPLRPLPGSLKLARRWEARVISTYDFGATTGQLAWLLPRHILLVILSRLRGKPLAGENLRAIPRFAVEFLLALWFLPGWIVRHGSRPVSAFWKEQAAKGMTPPRFGL